VSNLLCNVNCGQIGTNASRNAECPKRMSRTLIPILNAGMLRSCLAQRSMLIWSEVPIGMIMTRLSMPNWFAKFLCQSATFEFLSLLHKTSTKFLCPRMTMSNAVNECSMWIKAIMLRCFNKGEQRASVTVISTSGSN